MKVALIGNMNNNFFALMRYLRDMEIDAHLFLTNAEQKHFLPECDTFENKLDEFIHSLSWGHPLSYFTTSISKIKEDLESFDIFIVCGFVPAFLKKAKIRINIFVPFGGDIWGRPLLESLNPKRIIVNSGVRWIQKKGVPYAEVIHMGFTNELYENRINYLNKKHIRWLDLLPMIYQPEYTLNNLDKLIKISANGEYFNQIRNENEILILSHGRHYWYNKDLWDPAHKGTDKLIKAYANFINENKDKKIKLIFLEYGVDVEHSKFLIKELNLEEYVIWLPQMNRKEIMVCLLLCDIVCAEFTHSWQTSGVLYEALVGAKPILSYRDVNEHNEDTLYEIMNAYSIEDINLQLTKYLENTQYYKTIGKKGLEWFEDNVNKVLMKYNNYVEGLN